jgi:dolichyl-phosphate-mannose--protein O-mannosyl transferase
MFLFYMAPLVPFLIIGVTLGLGALLGPALPTAPAPRYEVDDEAAEAAAADAEEEYDRALRRRYWGMAGIAAYLALVIADFAWMWPIFTGGLLTTDEWHAHMWLPSWV